MTDVKDVLRRWQAGASVRSMADEGLADRKTISRYIKAAEQLGLTSASCIDDEVVHRVSVTVKRNLEGRPLSEHWTVLGGVRERLVGWLLCENPLQLTRVHELLLRDGIAVPYTTLRRYARQDLGWRRPRTTVRVDDPEPGQEAQIDFGEMGRIETAAGPKRLWVLAVVLSYSRCMFVYPTFEQTVGAVCDGLDAAWRFFGGTVPRVVLDNASSMVVRAHPTDPRLHPSFQEYAEARRFFPDPARVEHPKDKPRVERSIPYVRERWFKGERFSPSVHEIRGHAETWCREIANRRLHGTTRRVPFEDFVAHEQALLQPPPDRPFDVPKWVDAKVHPDHHVQALKALYSVPHLYAERRATVRVRADRTTVRIYFRDQLIKVHPRKLPGERSTDPNDYPVGKAAYATRSLNDLIARAQANSDTIGRFAERLLEGPLPWTKMRQAYALIRLCEKYGANRVDEVCRRSLEFDVIDVNRLQKMLRTAQVLEDAGSKSKKVIQLPSARFARPQDSFRTVRRSTEGEGS